MRTPTGRPAKPDSRRRTARFLNLACDGTRLDIAAHQAGVKPERALRILSDPNILHLAYQAAQHTHDLHTAIPATNPARQVA